MKNFKLGLFSYMSKNMGVKCSPEDISTANNLLDGIKKNKMDDTKEIKGLDTLLENVSKKGTEDKKALFDLLKNAGKDEAKYSYGERYKINALLVKWESAYDQLKAQNDVVKTAILAVTA